MVFEALFPDRALFFSDIFLKPFPSLYFFPTRSSFPPILSPLHYAPLGAVFFFFTLFSIYQRMPPRSVS